MQQSHYDSLPPDYEIAYYDSPSRSAFQSPMHPPSMPYSCPSIYHPSLLMDVDGMHCMSEPPYIASMQPQTLSSPWTSIPTQPSTFDTRLSSGPASAFILPNSTTIPGQRSFTEMSTQHKGFGNQAERAMGSSCQETRAGNQGKFRGRTTPSCLFALICLSRLNFAFGFCLLLWDFESLHMSDDEVQPSLRAISSACRLFFPLR